MSTDFAALLNVNADDIQPPKPLPPGPYTFIVKSHDFGESQQKKTPFVRFIVKPVAPGAGVDTSLLPEGWQEKEMRLDYYLTQDAMFRLKDFLEHLRLNISGRTIASVIPETINQQFIGNVAHKISEKDKKSVFANIDSTAAAV